MTREIWEWCIPRGNWRTANIFQGGKGGTILSLTGHLGSLMTPQNGSLMSTLLRNFRIDVSRQKFPNASFPQVFFGRLLWPEIAFLIAVLQRVFQRTLTNLLAIFFTASEF